MVDPIRCSEDKVEDAEGDDLLPLVAEARPVECVEEERWKNLLDRRKASVRGRGA